MKKSHTALYLFALGTLLLSACVPQGKTPELKPAQETVLSTTTAEGAVPAGTYMLIPTASTFTWTGRKVTGEHTGNATITQGTVLVDAENTVKTGSFTVDMASITNTDIQEPKQRQQLEQHLRSKDFFDTEEYPDAIFTIVQVQEESTAANIPPTYEVAGTLKLKGTTKPIAFPMTAFIDEQNHLIADASFSLDRTRWDVRYGSGKFFDKLGDSIIDDKFDVEIHLVLEKE